MLRDVFYYGSKPNVHPREQYAENLEDARSKATTRDFWIINEYCDYRDFDWDFDFEFLPDEDVWAEDHNNVWPSQHQKDSGTWLCPKEHSDLIIYRADVDPVIRKNIKTDNWVELDLIDQFKFDFSWHPDPTEPPYIYKWGCKFFPAELKHVLEYVVPGATQTKYMNTIVELVPQTELWVEYQEIDKHKFDLSWRPSPLDPPFIYVWGNKYIDGKLKPTLEYHAPDATDRKYMPELLDVVPEYDRWEIKHNIDKKSFDFSWRPDPREPDYNYVFGNNYYSAEVMPTVIYKMPNATQDKYVQDVVAKLAVSMDNWIVPDNLDTSEFDFSWVPNPYDPPYIYEFGTQWQNNGGPQYVVKGATEKKYVDIQKAKRLDSIEGWEVFGNHHIAGFDFSWHPDNTADPYIYVFGNQWHSANVMPTLQYKVEGATEVKYINDIVATLAPNMTYWKIPSNVDTSEFDFSWVPNPYDPPYIYQFGTQWQKTGGPIYMTFGATEVKYIDTIHAKSIIDYTNWAVPEHIDTSKFDFSWHPDETEPAYIYQFGTQWGRTGGPKYITPGATDIFYVKDIIATALPTKDNWEVPEDIDVRKFDFSWLPDENAPPYIYQFGTKLNNNDGPRYITPNNNGEIVYLERVEISAKSDINVNQYYIETTLEDLIKKHPNEVFWALRKNIDYSKFDFSWRPGTIEVAWELNYVHVFGSKDAEITQTYFVSSEHYLSGNKDYKFVEEIDLNENSLSAIFIKPDMFYIDRGNAESNDRYEQLKERFGDKIQKTRYLNSWVDTIARCNKKSTTELTWILSSELDYSEFDFDYYPNPWQMGMVHVFGTQWSHWGTTYLVNTETFVEDTKYIKIVEHLPNLNFVKQMRAKATACVHDVVFINHGNVEADNIKELLSAHTGRDVISVNYNKSYLNTIKELLHLLPQKKEHYVWVCSSVCDYSQFDFSYICDPFSRDNLHVFPSNTQKFGDTFFLDVNYARSLLETIDSLEQHPKLNFNLSLRTKRLPEPIIVVDDDTHINSLDKITGFPYATLVTKDNVDVVNENYDPINLWSSETKNIIITATGASRIIVPAEAKNHVKNELYDYPYIKRASKLTKSNPIDIVFLSNGEKCADENYQHLLKVAENLPNRVVRVDGVNGRVAAYHAAAEASNSPWFFTVFAKLQVNSKFDWSWQPDRMQVPKHYIFHSKNPVNGLVYGHQAMIAYNKKLTLNNMGNGLDFTLDDSHEVVPLISGTAHYNTDPYSTWRTAFREAIKLRLDDSDDSKSRLDAWLTKAEGDFAEFSTKGANDALCYFDEVNGDFVKLKLSYEWAWLRKRFEEL